MKKTLSYILICILCALIGFLVAPLIGRCGGEPEERIEYKTDTIYSVVFDTIIDYYPVETYDTIIDYVYVTSDTVLEVVQKQYKKDSSYYVWISGIEPLALDSIFVPKSIETITVTNTETITKVEMKWGVYVSGGFLASREHFYPELGICVSSPKKWSVGANIGVVDNFGIVYGINIGYKIFEL